MSVVAYADETTSLAEASGESAAVAEVTESEIAPISTEEVDSIEAFDGPVIEPVDLDEVYVDLVFTGIKGNLASIVSQSSFDITLTDENGQVAKASVDVSSAVDDRLKVKVDTKNLDTTKAIQFACSSDDFAISDICKVLEVVSVDGVVMGSDSNPATVVLEFVKEQFVSIKTKDANGNAVPNVPLSFEDDKGLKTEIVTDSTGTAKLSATKYAGMTLKVSSLSSKYSIPLGLTVSTHSPEIVIATEFDDTKVKDSSLILDVKTEVLTDISSNWAEFTLELTDASGVKHSIVNKSVGVTTHKLPAGSYSVKVVSSPYSTVKVANSVSISNATTLNVNVYPLSTFEVYDGGKEYDFEILGVSHLEGRHYTGTAKKVFGVMPGTVVQLKSDNVDKAYTVSSENSNETVTVELSKGTTSATPVGAPKTFDIIDALLLLAALLLLSLIAGGIYLYKSGNLKSKNVTAMLLVFAMLCTMAPANIGTNVYGYSQGVYVPSGPGTTKTTGFRIMYDLPVVLKFTLYPTLPTCKYGDTNCVWNAPCNNCKATHSDSPFFKDGLAQPTIDEYSAVSTLNNPLSKTSQWDFTSLYLVLDSNKKSAALPANHAMSWINGGILRYTEDGDGNKAKVILGFSHNSYDNDYYCNWEKQLRTVYAHKPDSINQEFAENYTTTFLKTFGESLNTSNLYKEKPSIDIANALNNYMKNTVLLERDADFIAGNTESSGYKAREVTMKLLIDSWKERIKNIYSNGDGISPLPTGDFDYWLKSIEAGYASIIVEPYACIYSNGGGGQGKRPQFFNMNKAEVDGLYQLMGDPNWVIRSNGNSSQWRRFSGLFHPNTVTSGGANLGEAQNGWGLYSIFGFAERVPAKSTTPLIAVTYNETVTWDNSAFAEALWDGSWTNREGNKVDFPLQTSDGRDYTASVLLEGLNEKLNAFDAGTLSDDEAKIVGDNLTEWLDAQMVLSRVASVKPDLSLDDFKSDVIRFIEFADKYEKLPELYAGPAGYNKDEHKKVSDVIGLAIDGSSVEDSSYQSIKSAIESTSGSEFYYLYHAWLRDTMLPDDIRNDTHVVETKLYEGVFDRGFFDTYVTENGITDTTSVRSDMSNFVHDMNISSAFYNAAAVCLCEKNRGIGSSTLSQETRIGESLNGSGDVGYVIDNNAGVNDNDLKDFLSMEEAIELDGTAEMFVNGRSYPTELTFSPNTQFSISIKVWEEGRTPQKELDYQQSLKDSGQTSQLTSHLFSDSLSNEDRENIVYKDLLLEDGLRGNVNVISSVIRAVNRAGDNLSYHGTPEEKLAALASDVARYVDISGGTDGSFSQILQTHVDTIGNEGSISGKLATDVKQAENSGQGIISETMGIEQLFALTAVGEGADTGYNFFINQLADYGVAVPESLLTNARNGVYDDKHKTLAQMYVYSLLFEYMTGAKNIINTSTGVDYLDMFEDRYFKSPMLTAKDFGVSETGDSLVITTDNLRQFWPEVDKGLTVLSSAYDVGNPYSRYYVPDEDNREANRAVVQFILNIRGTAANMMTVDPEEEEEEEPVVASGLEYVPQWRINKTYSSIGLLLDEDSSIQSLKWYIDKGPFSSGRSHKLYPDGSSKASFYMKGTIEGNSYDAYVVPPKSKESNKSITYSSYSASVSADSDITMYKVDAVDKINTASWVSDTLTFNKNGKNFVTTESKNVHTQTDAFVSDSFKVIYEYLTNDTFTHAYKVKVSSKPSRYRWYYEDAYPYLVPRTGEPYTPPNKFPYTITGNFLCYNAEDTTSKPGAATVHAEEGYSEFTALQGNLKVLPEVPMLYTDVNGNNSVHFTTGDKLRSLKPLSYHTFEYDMDTINPSVVGTSIATDQKALSLLNSMGMGATADKAQVIHKGAGTTTSYDVTGVIRTKTYAIDIDDSSLKSTWNSGSTYSASAINKSFLESFATANATGGYTANIDAVENLMVDGNKLGDVYQNVTITANGTSSERYELTVRAGVVTAVNGKKNWKTVYPELVPVIEEKLGLTPNRVFAAFASEKGDALDERAFETLSKALRENSSSIEEGKGWYSEDTTVLSLYVYTTEFDVPNMLFANKIPQEISAVSELATPRDKTKFYNVGRVGHLNLDLCLKGKDSAGNVLNVKLTYNTANAYPTGMGYANAKKLFVIPNVSILDTTLNQ